MVTPGEIHVYPLQEEGSHILDADLCNCMPEIRVTHAGKMVIHRRMGQLPIQFKFPAHWVQPGV